MLLKGKSRTLYQEAFQILENYRIENDIESPHWQKFLTDNEKAVENVVLYISNHCHFALHFSHKQEHSKMFD